MEVIDLLSVIAAGAIWGWIWFKNFREAGYARPGSLTVLMILPFTAVPTAIWFIFREIQAHRRIAREARTAEARNPKGWPDTNAGTGKRGQGSDFPGGLGDPPPQMPIHVTKLEYRVWRQPDAHPDDEIVQMKSHMSVADFHFRLNAQESGIHPSSIATRIQWTGEAECSFTIEAPATEDQLSGAWKTAAEMIDLQTVLATKPH